MGRVLKTVLWLVVLPVGLGLVAVSVGLAEPRLSPTDLPGTQFQGVLAGFGVLLVGVMVSRVLDTVAWRRMGEQAGLTPERSFQLYDNSPEGDGTLLPKPALTGRVRGRDITVRTYSFGGGRDDQKATYTVVETDLETPVALTTMVAPASNPAIDHLPSVNTTGENWTTIDDEVAVWGPVSEAQARELASGEVRDAVGELESGVVVGNVGAEIMSQMADAMPDDTGGAAGGLLDGSDDESNPSRKVSHKERTLLLDADALERRAQAVAVVADAVERAGNN